MSILARSQPQSESPNSIDHGFQVRLLSSLNLGLQVHLHTCSIPASKCITEFIRSLSQSASQLRLIKYIFREQRQLSGDSPGILKVETITGSLYSADSGVDRHNLLPISSYHTMEIHTLPFPTVGLTCSVRDLVDARNFMDPHGRVVSYLDTFPRSSSFMSKDDEQRFTQHHPLHCNTDPSVYPMNLF